MDAMIDAVQRIARASSGFYIGRTCFAERRLLQHRATSGRDCLFTLFWSSDLDAIRHVEEALIDRFKDYVRSDNVRADSAGRWPDKPSCVYVSWSFKSSPWKDVNESKAALVEQLAAEPAHVLSYYLRTTLTKPQAAKVLSLAGFPV